MRTVRVESQAGQFICLAEVADGHWTRFLGLMGRKELPQGRGLWIRPCKSVHTFFMRFALDLIYLNDDNAVAKTVSRVGAWRLSFGGRSARTVLELPPGTLDDAMLDAGEKLVIRPVEDVRNERPPRRTATATFSDEDAAK